MSQQDSKKHYLKLCNPCPSPGISSVDERFSANLKQASHDEEQPTAPSDNDRSEDIVDSVHSHKTTSIKQEYCEVHYRKSCYQCFDTLSFIDDDLISKIKEECETEEPVVSSSGHHTTELVNGNSHDHYLNAVRTGCENHKQASCSQCSSSSSSLNDEVLVNVKEEIEIEEPVLMSPDESYAEDQSSCNSFTAVSSTSDENMFSNIKPECDSDSEIIESFYVENGNATTAEKESSQNSYSDNDHESDDDEYQEPYSMSSIVTRKPRRKKLPAVRESPDEINQLLRLGMVDELPTRSGRGKKGSECKLCHKSFAHWSHFIVHTRTHTGERPFHCTQCSKRFVQSSNLMRHMRSHSDERPYPCTICKKRFKHLENLTGHMRSHTGERPYQCKICFKFFTHSSHLTTHVRTHTGEKPFECHICLKRFSQHASLSTHLKTHTRKKAHV